MGKEFFNGWALWEKMVFILACSIVVTIMAGCVKLVVDHYRMKKYASLPQKKFDLNREKSIIRSLSKKSAKTPMVQKRPRLVADGVEIPFGIRAIESGIEVDGVWISRSTTPVTLPSSRQSSTNSIHGYLPNSSSTNVSYRVDPATALPTQHLMSGARPSSRVIDRSVSQDSIITIPSAAEMSQPAAVRYPPHSYARYENRHFRKSSRAVSPSETQSRPVSSYGGSNSGSSIDSTHRSNSSGDIISSYQDVPVGQPRPVNHEALDMLQAHRLSHAAETGQLVPRSRKPGQSGDWTNLATHRPIVSGEVVNFSLPRDSTDFSLTRPTSSSSYQSNPFSTPSTERAPSVEWPEPQSATSDSSSRSYPPEPMSVVHGSRPSFSASRSDLNVMREVNSGFSVLRPGTLNAEAETRAARRNRSNSPQHQRHRSRSMSTDAETSDKRRSRRLQKRRPSEASVSERTSATMESDIQSFGSMFSDFSGFGSTGEQERPPSAYEIARGFEIERKGSPKFSFDAGARPPSAIEMARGAEVEQGAKYKF